MAAGQPLLAINTFVWYSPLTDSLLAEIAPRIAEWGYDAIELPLESEGDWDASLAHDTLDANGLTPVVCAVMPPGRELIAAAPDVVAATQAYVRHCVDVAAAVGSSCVVGPIYAGVGRTWRVEPAGRSQLFAELREALRPVVDYAGERGVLIGIEPLNRYETSVVNTTAQALEILGDLPEGAVGLNLDTYHMNIEEKDTPSAIRAAGDRLIHLQVCANDRGTPGEDDLDWVGIRDALVAIGYQRVIGIESFTADNKTIATAASIWRPLAPTQDAIAIDGLAFLREWRAGWPPELARSGAQDRE